MYFVFVCNYRLGNFKEALYNFEEAMRRSQQEAERAEAPYYNSISITTSYNLARFVSFPQKILNSVLSVLLKLHVE